MALREAAAPADGDSRAIRAEPRTVPPAGSASRTSDPRDGMPSVNEVVPPSATLAADQRVKSRIAKGAPVLHLAFGEAGLPVPAVVVEQLAAAARQNSYGTVAGSPLMRTAG